MVITIRLANPPQGFRRETPSQLEVCLPIPLCLVRSSMVVQGCPGDVCPVTYADNWEVWCLIELLDPLAAFLRTCRLPISVDKCWGWCLDPVGRKRLKQCQFDDGTLPVVLSAKCLGAEIAYSYRIAATTRNKRVRGLDSSGWPDCHWGSTVVSPSSE